MAMLPMVKPPPCVYSSTGRPCRCWARLQPCGQLGTVAGGYLQVFHPRQRGWAPPARQSLPGRQCVPLAVCASCSGGLPGARRHAFEHCASAGSGGCGGCAGQSTVGVSAKKTTARAAMYLNLRVGLPSSVARVQRRAGRRQVAHFRQAGLERQQCRERAQADQVTEAAWPGLLASSAPASHTTALSGWVQDHRCCRPSLRGTSVKDTVVSARAFSIIKRSPR